MRYGATSPRAPSSVDGRSGKHEGARVVTRGQWWRASNAPRRISAKKIPPLPWHDSSYATPCLLRVCAVIASYARTWELPTSLSSWPHYFCYDMHARRVLERLRHFSLLFIHRRHPDLSQLSVTISENRWTVVPANCHPPVVVSSSVGSA